MSDVNLSDNDIEYLARTMWGEARGEGATGMEAVGCVIRNRVEDDRWPDTYKEVCLQPKQFSCWNDGNPNREKMINLSADTDMAAKAYEKAAKIISGSKDITNGADHYYATYIDLPSWAKDMEKVCTYGVHAFYKS